MPEEQNYNGSGLNVSGTGPVTAVNQAINALPQDVKTLLADCGFTDIETDPTIPWQSAFGMTQVCGYFSNKPSFYVGDLSWQNQGGIILKDPNPNIADTTVHELDHGLKDIVDWLGNFTTEPYGANKGQTVTYSQSFADALQADLNALNNPSSPNYNATAYNAITQYMNAETSYAQQMGKNTANYAVNEVWADLGIAAEAPSLASGFLPDFQGIVPSANMTANELASYLPNTEAALISAVNNAVAWDQQYRVPDSVPGAGSGMDLWHPLCPGQDKNPAMASMSQAQQQFSCPLIIELSNDAVHTTSLENGVLFDMQNDGFEHMTAWVGPNDGLLVLNNDNGFIGSGAQLFGTSMPLANGTLASSGFAALAQYDIYNSGVINSSDPIWSELGVLMGNGELLTLNDVGITSINVGNPDSVNQFDANGNEELSEDTFTYTNGTFGTIADFAFQQDTTDTYYYNQPAISAAVAALPDAQGYGTVPNLQVAMQLDAIGTLENLVQQFVSTTNSATQNSLLTIVQKAPSMVPLHPQQAKLKLCA